MFSEAGGFDGAPVVEANPSLFQTWLVAGYESITGPGELKIAVAVPVTLACNGTAVILSPWVPGS